MKKVGVGIGIINVNRSPRLVNALGARRVPTIVGIINGRVMFYNDRVTVQGLKDFVMGLFPRGLIEKVIINYLFFKKVTSNMRGGSARVTSCLDHALHSGSMVSSPGRGLCL